MDSETRAARDWLADITQDLQRDRDAALLAFRRLLAHPHPLALRSDVVDITERVLAEHPGRAGSPLVGMLASVQEAVLVAPWIGLAVRPSAGRWRFVAVHGEELATRLLAPSEFLAMKERVVRGHEAEDHPLEIDLGPFARGFPRLREARSIGRGVEFLNRKLSSELFDGDAGHAHLLEFLRVHNWRGRQLMLNDRVADVFELRKALGACEERLRAEPDDAPWEAVAHDLQSLGLEAGWGDTVARTRETLGLLSDILEAPEPRALEAFLSRIPMIFSVAILSPHGFFGQDDVLGRPDTGGQVVYILDQVRALEHEMRRRLHAQGLAVDPELCIVTRLIPEADGTSCDRPREPVAGTRNARIVRVPFREANGQVVPHWISRFSVWPYLERFARDVQTELCAELGGRPDLVIGNYSDGNLVAYLLAERMGVTQCAIAHALEKTKYLHSDLYWASDEGGHNFPVQFTADLIAMNSADFILTSTYQEIAGREDSVGQYESYRTFSMPGLYRVVDGIDVFDPKFNIVAPGADPETYFPATRGERRLPALHAEIDELIHGDDAAPDRRGVLRRDGKRLLFSMARLDVIKNITGLVEWYARSPELQEQADLLLIAGHVDPARSGDDEERREIARMHALLDEHGLDDRVRWLGVHLDRPLGGELYRVIADRRGAFVQPARFEAFGLTVIEAMVSGLPTFATCYGGPLEIIEHGVSGFHIDPNRGDEAAARMADFLGRAAADPEVWQRVSDAAVERVHARYTWELHAERLMTLARVYGFWRHVTGIDRSETRRYLQLLYGLQYRPLAEAVGAAAAPVA